MHLKEAMVGKKSGGARHIKTIAITSGKGGVGNTNIIVNLAIAMQSQGSQVLIMDADLGLSNIDVLLHLEPQHTIQDVIRGEMALSDVMIQGPHGIRILPAGRGIQELTVLDEFQRLKMLDAFDACAGDIDVVLIDTGAGISENVTFFCTAAQETVIVTSSEPTSISCTNSLIKVLTTRYGENRFGVLLNGVKDPQEALDAFSRISRAIETYPDMSLDYLGFIPRDECVGLAVQLQKPFLDLYPDCGASREIRQIAVKLGSGQERVKGNLQFFIRSLLSRSQAAPLAGHAVAESEGDL